MDRVFKTNRICSSSYRSSRLLEKGFPEGYNGTYLTLPLLLHSLQPNHRTHPSHLHLQIRTDSSHTLPRLIPSKNLIPEIVTQHRLAPKLPVQRERHQIIQRLPRYGPVALYISLRTRICVLIFSVVCVRASLAVGGPDESPVGVVGIKIICGAGQGVSEICAGAVEPGEHNPALAGGSARRGGEGS